MVNGCAGFFCQSQVLFRSRYRCLGPFFSSVPSSEIPESIRFRIIQVDTVSVPVVTLIAATPMFKLARCVEKASNTCFALTPNDSVATPSGNSQPRDLSGPGRSPEADSEGALRNLR